MTVFDEWTDTRAIHWHWYPSFTGALAFDIGASGGKTAGIFADNFDSVIACEPSKEPFEYLRTHVPDNVTPLNIAVSDHDGEVTLTVREYSLEKGRGYLYTDNTLPEWGDEIEQVTVPCRSLDSLAEEYGQPNFVKIDVEGHEVIVVQGGMQVFADPDLRYLVEVHDAAKGERLKELLPDWELIRHEHHPENSYRWHNHYWLAH